MTLFLPDEVSVAIGSDVTSAPRADSTPYTLDIQFYNATCAVDDIAGTIAVIRQVERECGQRLKSQAPVQTWDAIDHRDFSVKAVLEMQIAIIASWLEPDGKLYYNRKFHNPAKEIANVLVEAGHYWVSVSMCKAAQQLKRQ